MRGGSRGRRPPQTARRGAADARDGAGAGGGAERSAAHLGVSAAVLGRGCGCGGRGVPAPRTGAPGGGARPPRGREGQRRCSPGLVPLGGCSLGWAGSSLWGGEKFLGRGAVRSWVK